MKIFDAQQTRGADNATISNQGITSLQLMERAANEIFLRLKSRFPDLETVFHIFCGQGNNGGDGLQLARMLNNAGYPTAIYVIASAGNPNLDFLESKQHINEAQLDIKDGSEIQFYGGGRDVVIDALFGTGLTRELNEECLRVIEAINSSGAYVISIDMPSGMFMDKPTTEAVIADVVLTYQFPKLPLFLSSNYKYVGKIVIVPIGLDQEYLYSTQSNENYIDAREIAKRYKPVPTYAHKGTQGHTLTIGGSYGKTGAIVLASKAALKAGCGLVTAYVPECGYNTLQGAFPEAMVVTSGGKYIVDIDFDLEIQAIAIGMGLGQEQQTQEALYRFLQHNTNPLVIDADALNIISQHKQWLELVPEGSVLTPHPKELQRLIGEWQDDFDKLEKMKIFSKTHNILLVAKDARTMIIHDEDVYINSTGNSALATAGSGDVLAGIVAGLIAQGYHNLDAAVVGVYLHGLTADIAVRDIGKQAFTASSILDYLGKAFLTIEQGQAL